MTAYSLPHPTANSKAYTVNTLIPLFWGDLSQFSFFFVVDFSSEGAHSNTKNICAESDFSALRGRRKSSHVPSFSITLKQLYQQRKTRARRCACREAIRLGERKARTAKQPQGPAPAHQIQVVFTSCFGCFHSLF